MASSAKAFLGVSHRGAPPLQGKHDQLAADLLRASALNPFVAEPHVVRAQVLMQQETTSPHLRHHVAKQRLLRSA